MSCVLIRYENMYGAYGNSKRFWPPSSNRITIVLGKNDDRFVY